ncbi:TetR/AcrR family transcriptional regulator [Derxia gummosa]|uniref:TetR/AcrR family transcriptional regulator n=1 Tax=Derxia gummosa DSM 723 TaxID=1121388 RepID=A0A8B6X9L8_9BURK|nr:TetR/AcrR family transcriptional regulator [Derxia gummosa]
MARPREFDENTALDAAMGCFWHRGYEATSMRDLGADMGMTAASIYNAFGDKAALFRRALEHYLDGAARERIARLEQMPSPRAAVMAFLDELVDASARDRAKRGCMLVNTALELGPHDAEMRRLVGRELAAIEGFFRGRLRAADAAGELPPGSSPDDLARLLLGLLLGIRVLARSKPQRALLEGMLRPVRGLLGLACDGDGATAGSLADEAEPADASA